MGSGFTGFMWETGKRMDRICLYGKRMESTYTILGLAVCAILRLSGSNTSHGSMLKTKRPRPCQSTTKRATRPHSSTRPPPVTIPESLSSPHSLYFLLPLPGALISLLPSAPGVLPFDLSAKARP